MAKAIATCTCATCGATFTRSTIKRNRSEADSWIEWAEANIDECPDCYAARKREVEAEKAASYGLPEITGVSEKQISYANDLRIRYVKNYAYKMDKIKKLMDMRSDPDFRAKVVARGMTFEQVLDAACKATDCTAAYICLTSTSAREIIDALRCL